MRIAIFTSGNLPVPAVQGGAIENLVDELIEYNEIHKLHTIDVYSVAPTVPLPANLNSNGTTYYHIDTTSFMAKVKRRIFLYLNPSSNYYNYFIEYFLHEALKIFRRHKYDVVILESRPGYAPSIKAIDKNVKVIVHLHNDWMSDRNDEKLLAARKSIDLVVTVSDFINNRVNVIDDGVAVRTVHNGIDLAHFISAQACERANLGFKPDDIILVYSGRINSDKGVSELINAFLQLQHIKQLKLLIIGSSFFGEDIHVDPFIESLQQSVRSMKDRIVFTGYIAYNQIPSYLKMADIAVIPSIWDDPFPTTVLEALAVGLPIVATKSGGIPESAGEDNLLIENDGNVVSNLVSSISRLIENKELRQQVGESNRKRSSLYDKAIYAENFFKVISQ